MDAVTPATSSTPALGAAQASEASLSRFLSDLMDWHIGELVVVHTGRTAYVGRLLSITVVCVTLDSDSEWLDQRVLTRIDSSRIEAVEVLPY